MENKKMEPQKVNNNVRQSKYTQEFKQDLVKLVSEIGATKASKQLKLKLHTVNNIVQAYKKADNRKIPTKPLYTRDSSSILTTPDGTYKISSGMVTNVPVKEPMTLKFATSNGKSDWCKYDAKDEVKKENGTSPFFTNEKFTIIQKTQAETDLELAKAEIKMLKSFIMELLTR
jgi:transposase-like protein